MYYGDKYEELNRQSGNGNLLLRNRILGVVCVRKELEFYDKTVFDYLKDNHCPHIPDIYDYREEDGKLIVIESYIQGRTLDEYLAKEGPDRNEKLRIIGEILDGIEFLHCAPVPIIHRDLKPDNIMIDNTGTVKIIDYDAAKTYKPGETKDTTLIGTIGSAAPEQFGFAQSDPRTDIYAMGILIRKVFGSDTSYDLVVAKATRMDPDQRYQTVDELRKALFRGRAGGVRSLRSRAAILVSAFAAIVLLSWGIPHIINGSRTAQTEIPGTDVNVHTSESPSVPSDMTDGGLINVPDQTAVSSLTAYAVTETAMPTDGSSGNISPTSAPGTYSKPSAAPSVSPSTSSASKPASQTTAAARTSAPAAAETADPTEASAYSDKYMSDIVADCNKKAGYRYSRSQLIDELDSRDEDISREEWTKAVDKAGINWSNQAANSNTYYCSKSSAPNDIIKHMQSDGFTSRQISWSFICDQNLTMHQGYAERTLKGWLKKNRYQYKSEYLFALEKLGYPDEVSWPALCNCEEEFKAKAEEGRVIEDI